MDMNSNDNLQNNKHWKTVEGYLKHCVIIGFPLAGLSYAILAVEDQKLQGIAQALYGLNHIDAGITKATIFFILGYVTVVQFYFWKSVINLKSLRVVKTIAWRARVIWSFGAIVAGLVFISAPFYILWATAVRERHYWRSAIIHDLLANSYVGLSVFGGILLWTAVLGLLMIFSLAPKIFTNHVNNGAGNER